MIEIGLVVLFLVLLGVAIYFDLQLGMHFMNKVTEGEMYFAVTGEGQIYKVIMAFPENTADKLIESAQRRGIRWTCKDSSWLSDRFGIYFVSWAWPAVKLYRFKIVAEGLKDGTKGKEIPPEKAPMRSWLYQEVRTVFGLRRKFPRPVLVERTELKDRFTVDSILMEQLEVVDFYPPIFEYHGDFFRQISSFSEGAMNDMVVKDPLAPKEEMAYSYTEFVNLNKGEGSNFANTLRNKINYGVEFDGATMDREEGLIAALGIQCNRVFVHKTGLSPDQQEVEDAVKLGEITALKADALRTEAGGKADALRTEAGGKADAERTVALGKADGIRSIADAEMERTQKLTLPFAGLNADPETITKTVGAILKTESLPANLTTFVEGGGLATVTVTAKEKKDE